MNAYLNHKQAVIARQRLQAHASANIGPPPPIKNLQRRQQCENSLRLFCETYLRETFCLNWSDDHLEVIDTLERVVFQGGKYALAMPRGSGKTSLCLAAALWAILFGHKRFVVLVGATAELAKRMLESIKTIVESNELLSEDFPEVCHPVKALQGVGQRRGSQHIDGRRTRIQWGQGEVHFPDVEYSLSAGAVIACKGIEGSMRGLQAAMPDGSTIRPDLAVVDDPQTDATARSLASCAKRERAITQAIGRLGGPSQPMAVVIPCTIIAKDDLASRMLDSELHPDYRGRVFKLLKSMPSDIELWKRYKEVRKQSLATHGDIRDATKFYVANINALDAGAVPSWPERFEPLQASAIQYAMDLWCESESSFFAECQNEPMDDALGSDLVTLDPKALLQRMTADRRGVVPSWATMTTGFIDIQGNSLWWLVASWDKDLRGHVVDWGVWPKQPGVSYLALRNVGVTLAQKYKSTDTESQLRGLAELSAHLRATYPIVRLGIDANWHQSTDAVFSVARTVGSGKCLPMFGRSITAGQAPMNKWKRDVGDKLGQNWILQRKRKQGLHCSSDVNFWKSTIAAGLTAPQALGISLPDGAGLDLVDQLASEYGQRVSATGRVVTQWTLRPGRDNHWWDGIVSAAVLASIEGASLPGQESKVIKRRLSGAEIAERRRALAQKRSRR